MSDIGECCDYCCQVGQEVFPDAMQTISYSAFNQILKFDAVIYERHKELVFSLLGREQDFPLMTIGIKYCPMCGREL